MDSDEESEEGPNDNFFIDPDIHQITRLQLGIQERILDDLFTGKTLLFSIGQSIIQSVNQSVNQSIGWSISQSISQSINRSVDQSFFGVLHTCISGESSKRRWERMEGYEHLRFPLNSELSCLVNRCVLPFLRSLLLGSTDSFFIYLAMEVQFHQVSRHEKYVLQSPPFFHVHSPGGHLSFDVIQMTNWEDIATRWTSHRNQSWYLTHLFSREQRLEFITTIVSDFLDELYEDIDSMEVIHYIPTTNRHTDHLCKHQCKHPEPKERALITKL